MGDALLDVARHARRPSRFCRGMNTIRQRGEWRAPRFEDLVRIFVMQLVERKSGPGFEDAEAIFQSLRVASKQPAHLLGALEAALPIALGGKADAIDRHAQ